MRGLYLDLQSRIIYYNVIFIRRFACIVSWQGKRPDAINIRVTYDPTSRQYAGLIFTDCIGCKVRLIREETHAKLSVPVRE